MQLGPVLRSAIAKDYGLQLSYLERIMDLDMYKRDETKFANHGSYDPMLVCRSVFVIIYSFSLAPDILFEYVQICWTDCFMAASRLACDSVTFYSYLHQMCLYNADSVIFVSFLFIDVKTKVGL